MKDHGDPEWLSIIEMLKISSRWDQRPYLTPTILEAYLID